MAINSNFDVLEPEAWVAVARENFFPMRPMVSNAATNVAGADLEGLVASKNKTVNISRAVKTETSDVEDYTGADYTFADPDTNNAQLIINRQKGIGFKIDKTDEKFSLINLVNNQFLPRLHSLIDAINADVKAEARKFQAAFADIGTDATVMDDADIREARRILLARKFVNPEDGMIGVLDPTVEVDLTGLDLFHQADQYGARGPLLDGAMGRAFGFDFFVDSLGSDHTVATVTDATVAANEAVGQTEITIDDGAGGSATVSLSEGDVIYFGTANGEDQFYTVQSQTGTVLTLKEPLRDAISDNDPIVPVDIASGDTGREQFLYDPRAISLVTAGMAAVDGSTAGGVRRAIGFEPVNGVNYTLSVQETMQGANVQIEVLYGVKNFYEDLGVRYIRGNEAKS